MSFTIDISAAASGISARASNDASGISASASNDASGISAATRTSRSSASVTAASNGAFSVGSFTTSSASRSSTGSTLQSVASSVSPITSTSNLESTVQIVYGPGFTTTYTSSPTQTATASHGLSTGASAGIGVSVGIVAIIASICLYILWRRRWKQKRDRQPVGTDGKSEKEKSDGQSRVQAELEGHDSRVEVPAGHGESELHAEPELLGLARPSVRNAHGKPPATQPYAGLATQNRGVAPEVTGLVDIPADEGTMSSTAAPTGTASEFGDAIVAIEHLEAEREKVRQQKQKILREELQVLEMREHDLEQQIARRQRSGR